MDPYDNDDLLPTPYREKPAKAESEQPSDAPTCSPSSDTPETYAATHHTNGSRRLQYDGIVALSIKLERERDAARAMLAGLITSVSQCVGGQSMMHPQLTRCIIAAQKIIPQNAQHEPQALT